MLVQYTYGPAAPVPPDLGAELGLIGERTSWVLANLPPAAVWRYRRSRSVPSLSRAPQPRPLRPRTSAVGQKADVQGLMSAL